jgi:hypothetical protein
MVSSLFYLSISDKEKTFYNIDNRCQSYKTFLQHYYNKLEGLTLVNNTNLVKWWLGAYLGSLLPYLQRVD